jgi:hypothetical protein
VTICHAEEQRCPLLCFQTITFIVTIPRSHAWTFVGGSTVNKIAFPHISEVFFLLLLRICNCETKFYVLLNVHHEMNLDK